MISKHFYITNKHHRIVERREFPWKKFIFKENSRNSPKKKGSSIRQEKESEKKQGKNRYAKSALT
jgi:hypothetical protein